jgi:hypothetical protein
MTVMIGYAIAILVLIVTLRVHMKRDHERRRNRAMWENIAQQASQGRNGNEGI